MVMSMPWRWSVHYHQTADRYHIFPHQQIREQRDLKECWIGKGPRCRGWKVLCYPRFHPTDVKRNLVLTQKVPTPTYAMRSESCMTMYSICIEAVSGHGHVIMIKYAIILPSSCSFLELTFRIPQWNIVLTLISTHTPVCDPQFECLHFPQGMLFTLRKHITLPPCPTHPLSCGLSQILKTPFFFQIARSRGPNFLSSPSLRLPILELQRWSIQMQASSKSGRTQSYARVRGWRSCS